ncbi:hypothetical protein AQUCO_00300141v1 [Aquilegia coerulea]|uniref:PWI domain-containing protein n=1 Tax=Aquilegia coerulea TaxID=218851 RepID=A0A2G5EXJ1_AQUCA|nr:hypothetical protein AQUCO_00300141v1 [Aquilegia coerulea]PIA60429.1 hypothetical protein AQUCO_00300141v1 [Aquilegia coerulea]PIA60431.1 hypothetical protein AQUCO_00300141v1 [Aquilegia coerulea]PIA60432.1 hypothetical protein AQUCO_00300141v1 [Aquilegia coerulea]
MSGGFFRGTSADQDTRFSNKQAKLLKSQKFAPELDQLVDGTKVKMDVIKPWIATRVTELLGFEDEVLIGFIYELLEKKDVNGKEVQIQITGFMEKNTGKFMRELWGLLLSAQKNASGVPQQFLDAKEEEIRKKKVETDRITHEIQKKKEAEQEKQKKLDDEIDKLKAMEDASQPDNLKGSGERNGLRGKNRISRSPHSEEHSPTAERIIRSTSISKSNSISRSYSGDRHKSRSISRSPQSRGRSISPDKRYRSPRRRSLSPRRKISPRRSRSPLRRRSPYSRRRSPSYSRRRSPSYSRRRSPSPRRRRSPSLRRRRSPTPVGRRSPSPRRRRSPSIVRRSSVSPVTRRSSPPMRRRSPPIRRRSPSPARRRSPIPFRRRSPNPSRYRSPTSRWRSPSPPRRRSPSPLRRRSPLRSPRPRRRSPLRPPRQIYRSGSPYGSRSPVRRRRRSLSRDHDVRANGVRSRRYHDDYVSERTRGKESPAPEREDFEHSAGGHDGLVTVKSQLPISLRSPQRDRSDARRKVPVLLPSHENSPSHSGSSVHTGKSSPSEDRSMSEGPLRNTRERVTPSDSESPVRQRREFGAHPERLEPVREEGNRYSRVDGIERNESSRNRIKHSPRARGHGNIARKDLLNEEFSPERLGHPQAGAAHDRLDDRDIRTKDREKKSEKASLRIDRPVSPANDLPHVTKEIQYIPGSVEVVRVSHDSDPDEHPSVKQQSSPSTNNLHTSHPSQNVLEGGLVEPTENTRKSIKRVDVISKNTSTIIDSDSEIEKNKRKDVERRKHKRQDRHHVASDDDTSDDSHIDERKEAKRRRKEEKKMRKEEKRRRREERHRRKEERRASKLKSKTVDTVAPPLEFGKDRSDADDSDDRVASKINSHSSDVEEAESEQKKLEIELRKKALESLRAKKAINS